MNGSLGPTLALLELPRRRVFLAILAAAATLGSALTLAALSAWLITRAWQMPPVLDLSVAVVAVRALGISRGIFRYLERLLSHDTALRGTTAARAEIYRRLAAGDPAAAAGLRPGDLLRRTGADVDAVGEMVIRAVVPIGAAVIVSGAAVTLVAVILPGAAVVLALSLAVAGILAPWLAVHAARSAETASAGHTAEFSAAALGLLDHAAELRVAGKLDATLLRATAENIAAARAHDRASRPAALAVAATPLAIGVSVLGALLIGLIGYGGGSGLSPMELAVITLLPLAAFESTATLPGAALALLRARLAADRIAAVLSRAGASATPGLATSTTTSMPESPRGAAGSLRGSCTLMADNLRCGWSEDQATEPLTLSADRGDRIAIVGPSGSGKTSVLLTLAGLLRPRAGTVRLGGIPMADLDQAELRSRVAYFAEDSHIFGTTILENLRVARGDVTVTEAVDALGKVGLERWLAELPDGVHTPLGAGSRELSGGQRRRLLLARALLGDADILLLDEPTEHLDDADGARLQRSLLDRDGGLLRPEQTLILVSHQLPADHGADRVLRLRTPVRRGTRDPLATTP